MHTQLGKHPSSTKLGRHPPGLVSTHQAHILGVATTSRPLVRDSIIIATQASVSSLSSEFESENDTDRVPTGSRDCEPTVPSGPSLLDNLRAPQKSELTCKRVLLPGAKALTRINQNS